MTQIPTTTYGSGSPGAPGTLDRSGKPSARRFYGKYRGKVAENIDPLFLGRILPIVPAVSELPLTWATPCVPYAGPAVGLYAIPPLDANVWIEFEGGDPNYPIWTGCFWEEGQAPLEAPTPEMFIFKTISTTLLINEIPGGGGISLEITPPAVATPITITLDSAGVQITTEATFALNSQVTTIASDSTISLESPDINLSGAALTVDSTIMTTNGELLTVQSDATNLGGQVLSVESALTNIGGQTLVIENVETNILSASLDIECGEFNTASPLVTLEGVLNVEGAITEDEMPVAVIPIG